jgi:ubiquitin-protein ligase E3 A
MDYEGDDMEDTFMQTFRICYQDIFGNTFNKDLKENGDQIFVNKNNRQVRNILSHESFKFN